MGVEFHITRRHNWYDEGGPEIGFGEWLRYVDSDPERQLDPVNGPYCVLWSGPSAHPEPWLKWARGNIRTKWPDTSLCRKMLRIAAVFDARIQDDETTVYARDTDWEFDPNRPYGTS